MTGLQEYILIAWKLQTPFAAKLWKLAGLSRTTPGKLSWGELDSLRRVLVENWPGLAGKRDKAVASPIGELELDDQVELSL